jgi:hypothetical protein
MNGLGTAEHDYAPWWPGATIGEVPAVQGETVRAAGSDVETWLTRHGLQLEAHDPLKASGTTFLHRPSPAATSTLPHPGQ